MSAQMPASGAVLPRRRVYEWTPKPKGVAATLVKNTTNELRFHFDEWYAVYPRHVEPDSAYKAYKRALARGASQTALLEGARRYALSIAGTAAKFIKMPRNWLNEDCWTSEYASHITENEQQDPLAGRSADFLRHFEDYLTVPAMRLHLCGRDERQPLVQALARLYLRIEWERKRAGFQVNDYALLMGNSELLRQYIDWLMEQGWHTATLKVLEFDSPAFQHFCREQALADQYGRDPITKQSRFT